VREGCNATRQREEINMTTEATTGLDVEALRRGIEERDAEAMLSLFADDAELRLVDRNNPPSSPQVYRGKQAIADYYGDICGRDMTHRLEQLVVGDGSAAFTEDCAYPDGTRVLCAAVLELRDGKITRKTGVQAWDE
jgi:ketosteroid isomerase-like protein